MAVEFGRKGSGHDDPVPYVNPSPAMLRALGVVFPVAVALSAIAAVARLAIG